MSKKKIFLHIGTHKTATTTIQKGCCENREALLAAGWLFPQTGMYMYGHHNLAWEMCSGNEQPWNHINSWVRFRPEWGNFEQLIEEIEQSTAENVILSSEDFDGLTTERIERLGTLLADYCVEVIVYLREQASFMQSAWAQFVKSGFITISYSSFVDQMLNSAPEIRRYFGAYDLFLLPWMDVFGAEHVHPKRFSRDAFRGHFFYDFLWECQLMRVEEFVVPINQNISPGYKCLEVMRLLGSQVDTMENRSKLVRFVQRYGHEHGWDIEKLNLIDQQVFDKVSGYYADVNQWVSDHFFDGKSLFGAFIPKPISTFNKQDLIQSEWEELTQETIAYLLNNEVPVSAERP